MSQALITRAEYMKTPGFESHHAYYVQGVTPALTRHVVDRIGADRILKSTDKFFNDIKLSVPLGGHSTDPWRDCVNIELAGDFNLMTKACAVRACSDSDRVCIAKAAAYAWKQAQQV
jgi:hypothetical protein